MYWLIALQKQYEADIAEHTAVLKTFVNNSVGVADHNKFMSILKDRVNKLSHAKDSLKTVKDIMEKKVPIVEENKCKCKKEK